MPRCRPARRGRQASRLTLTYETHVPRKASLPRAITSAGRGFEDGDRRDALSYGMDAGQSVNPNHWNITCFSKGRELFNHVGIFVRHVVGFARIGFEIVESHVSPAFGCTTFQSPMRAACASPGFGAPSKRIRAGWSGFRPTTSAKRKGRQCLRPRFDQRNFRGRRQKVPRRPGKIADLTGGNPARPVNNHRHPQAAFVKVAANAAKRPGALEKFRVNAAIAVRTGIAREENHRVAFDVQSVSTAPVIGRCRRPGVPPWRPCFFPAAATFFGVRRVGRHSIPLPVVPFPPRSQVASCNRAPGKMTDSG